MKIPIEKSALDSLKAMAQQLQDELDMLMDSLKELIPMFEEWHEEFPDYIGDKEGPALEKARSTIAACTETTQVLA